MFNRSNQSFSSYCMHSQNLDALSNTSKFHNKNDFNALNYNLDEFSFKVNNYNTKQLQKQYNQSYASQNNTLSLRQNLIHLQKDEIIQILLQQIRSNKVNLNNSKNQKCTKIISERPNIFEQTFSPQKLKYRQTNSNNLQSNIYKQKYQNLVKDFQEYISNTNQAQQHFRKVIEDLKKDLKHIDLFKKENKRLEQQIDFYKNSSSRHTKHTNNASFQPQQKLKHLQKTALINKLQQTVENYLNINNELTKKIQKLQKSLKSASQNQLKLQNQLQRFSDDKENLTKENQNYKSIIDELKDYINERRQAKQKAQMESIDSNSQYDSVKYSSKCKRNFDSDIMNGSQIPKVEMVGQESGVFSNYNKKQNDLFFNQSSHNSLNSLNSLNKASPQINFSQKFQQQQFDLSTFRVLQVSNKQLKMTNFKLQQLLEKKSQKIRSLLDDIQNISEERVIMRQQLVILKCQLKKHEQLQKSHNIQTMININSQSKFSNPSTKHHQTYNNKDSSERQSQNSHSRNLNHSNISSQVPSRVIGGIKLVNSSVYTMKNSQSSKILTSHSNCQKRQIMQKQNDNNKLVQESREQDAEHFDNQTIGLNHYQFHSKQNETAKYLKNNQSRSQNSLNSSYHHENSIENDKQKVGDSISPLKQSNKTQQYYIAKSLLYSSNKKNNNNPYLQRSNTSNNIQNTTENKSQENSMKKKANPYTYTHIKTNLDKQQDLNTSQQSYSHSSSKFSSSKNVQYFNLHASKDQIKIQDKQNNLD